MTKNISEQSNKERKIKLLHLDHLQRETLEPIITKFLHGHDIGIAEVVESFKAYILKLVNLSASGEKQLCESNGALTTAAQHYLKKFTDAILIASKYAIHYNKIFASEDVKNSLMNAARPSNRLTSHYMHELEYRIKITTYSFLESDNTKTTDYLDNIKDFYFRSIATVNPQIAQRSFIDQIVSILDHDTNHTISDISDLANKYALYLGKSEIDQDKIEKLVHKYSDISMRVDEGLLHAAKIEIFKILEGI